MMESLESRVLLDALTDALPVYTNYGDLPGMPLNLEAGKTAAKHKKSKTTKATAPVTTGPDAGVGQTVVGRYLAYGGTPAFGDVIAPDKTALLPGQTASFANVSSYSEGINEIVIDVNNAASSYSASDFTFRAGLVGDPSTWAAAPAPVSVSAVAGAGVNGSTRIMIKWADGAIENEWLQVTVNAAADTFYFGNLVGDTGGASGNPLVVSSADEAAVDAHPASFMSPATVTNVYDFNRDGKVDATDAMLARRAAGEGLSNLVAPAAETASTTVYNWQQETINGVLNIWAPDPSDFGTTYTVTDPNALYGSPGVPQITAIHQGPTADCYFLSAEGSLAMDDPARIEALVKNDPGGGWAVTFQYFNSATQTYVPVVIHTADDLSSTMQTEADGQIWPLVLEKAYAAFRTWNGSTSTDTMASLDWGFPSAALSALNDNNFYQSFGILSSSGIANMLQSDLAANEPVLFQTSATAPDMVQSHVYVITGISTDASGTVWVTTYNPWGFYDTRTETDLLSNGIGAVTVGTA